MKILFAPDQFKGFHTAVEDAHAMCRGWLSLRPEDGAGCVPLSDGGEGFARVRCPGGGVERVRV